MTFTYHVYLTDRRSCCVQSSVDDDVLFKDPLRDKARSHQPNPLTSSNWVRTIDSAVITIPTKGYLTRLFNLVKGRRYLQSDQISTNIMKSSVLLILFAASTVAFSPVPTMTQFGRQRMSVASTRTVMFMASPTTEEKTQSSAETINGESPVAPVETKEEEMSETQKLMVKVKEAGTAGVISYALWELGFWAFSVPVCVFGYREVTG